MRHILILLILLPLTLFAQTIQGPIATCINDCATYTFESNSSGPFIWNMAGVNANSMIGESVEICWSERGNQIITVTDVSASPGNHLTTLSVLVHENEGVELRFPIYPNCESRDTINNDLEDMQELPPLSCKTVCGGSSATYQAINPIGSYEWDVEGASDVTIANNSVAVTWNALGAGYINVINTDDNLCEVESSYCIEILEVPEASAIVSTNSICLGQTIAMSSNTSGVVDYYWDSGDGQFASGSQVAFTYDLEGSFTGSLIVQTECFCFDTTYFNIYVNVNPGPEILCLGTICAQDTATYYAANVCSQYDWNISSNGSIVEGGSNSDGFVKVVWQNGPSGQVTLATPNCGINCAMPTTEIIPVISSSINIEGIQEVCKGSQSVYRAPRFGGTEYSWSIVGPGSIVSGFGTEEIVVEWEDYWNTPSTAIIELQYENCFLDCGGNALLNIDLKDPFDILGTSSICPEGNNYIFASYNWNNITADWNITAPDGSLVYSSTAENSVSYDFSNGPGIYILEVSTDPILYCDPIKTLYIPVEARPEINVNIIGDLVVCAGQVSNYTLPINAQLFNVRWVIDDGGTTTNYNGHEISYTWTSNGPYSVSVSISDVDKYCYSESKTITPVAATNSYIAGSSIVCLDTKHLYQVEGLSNPTTDWKISPSDAGSLRKLPDGSLEIHWHLSGTHSLTAEFCTASISYIVDVLPESAIVINAPLGVCPGEQAAVAITLPVGASVVIKDETLSTVSSTGTLLADPGFYLIEMTDINGCLSQETFEVEEFILPEIRISTPDDTGFCPGLGEVPPTLYAINTLSGYTYEWYRDGVALGETTHSITASVYGFYYVVSTNVDGCSTISNEIEVFEYCGPNGRCNGRCSNFPPCEDGTYVSFTSTDTGYCNEYSFTNTSADYVPGTILYDFADVDAGADSISILENPDHTFTYAGHYLVTMIAEVTANVNPPYCWDYEDIVVPVAANFTAAEGCANDGIQFHQEATFVSGYAITNYSWDFGDPSSGTDNTSSDADPMHIFSAAGSYTVSLTVTSNSGCLARISKEIIIQDGPNVDFDIPSIHCLNTATPFDALISTDVVSVNWNFGDLASGSANESLRPITLHTFSNNQLYNVSLSASNIYGCTNTISKSIDINTSVLAGDITLFPSGPICLGDSVTLTAPTGGLTYLWSDGTLGQTKKVGDNNNYQVTITDIGGCQYVPNSVQIEFFDVPDLKIKGIIQLNGFQSETYTEEMEICDQESFYLSVPYQFGLEYLWTVNNVSSNQLYYWNGLSNLAPGTHVIGVNVTNPTNGCIYDVEPFTVVIHPRATSPIVVSDQSENCEGILHTLSVSNYDSNFKYYWSTGDEGPSTTTTQAGNYTVKVINEYGCEGWPGGYIIHPLPRKDIFPDGCKEVCFPDTICLPENLGYTFEWLKDGASMASNTTWLEITEPGEYQVIMSHYSGCTETSEILSLGPKSSEHKINGIVYLDQNQDGIYNAGDQLLENAVVQLIDGSTTIETVNSDVNGAYEFDQLGVSNPTILVDVSSLGYNIPTPIQSENFAFTKCIEEQNKNFPFIDECQRQAETIELNTCNGQPLTYETLTIMPGDIDSLVYTTSSGCDSTLIIHAIELPPVTITIDTESACDLNTGGNININSNLIGSTFSIDNASSFSPALTYTNLSPGMHELWVLGPNGCPQTIPFMIDMIDEPAIDITTTQTCSNESEGSANITVLDGQNYTYILDGISLGNQAYIPQLVSGNHTLEVSNSQGCNWEVPFIVSPYEEPMINITPNASCIGMSNGSMTITNFGTGILSYSLDNNNESTDEYYENLSPGNHLLTVNDQNGCAYTYGFIIEEEELPMVTLIGQNACEAQDNGSVTLTQLGSGNYTYSLDGIDYQSEPYFNGLSGGEYIVYIENINGCATTRNLTIQTLPTPLVVIETNDACEGINNGSAQFASTESGLEYSIDGVQFSPTPSMDNLTADLYTLYVQTIEGCSYSYPFEIEEAVDLEVVFTDPVMDCSITNIVLEPEVISAVGEATFVWSDGSTNPSLAIITDGLYSVEIIDNCSTKYYEWEIGFTKSSIGKFYTPNIFSPNGDGVNDIFLPNYKDSSQISSYTLDVFDRWGALVFHSDELHHGWDGMFASKTSTTGVFVYIIRAEGNFCNQTKSFEIVGDVTVIR